MMEGTRKEGRGGHFKREQSTASLSGSTLAYSTDQVALTEVLAECMAGDLPVPFAVHLAGQHSTVHPPALPLPGQEQVPCGHTHTATLQAQLPVERNAQAFTRQEHSSNSHSVDAEERNITMSAPEEASDVPEVEEVVLPVGGGQEQ